MFAELMRSEGLRQVWHILKKYPEAREDNRTLYKLFYNQFYKRHNNLDKPCPVQSQVARWRLKAEEIDYSLRPSKETMDRRRKSSRYYANGAIPTKK